MLLTMLYQNVHLECQKERVWLNNVIEHYCDIIIYHFHITLEHVHPFVLDKCFTARLIMKNNVFVNLSI